MFCPSPDYSGYGNYDGGYGNGGSGRPGGPRGAKGTAQLIDNTYTIIYPSPPPTSKKIN